MTRHTLTATLLASATALTALPASAQTELTMYYPIAVGGALTQVVDGLIAEFHDAHPDIRVNSVYAGNYDDTRVRVLSAISSGDSAPLSVLFSIDALDLIEQEMIIPFDQVLETDEEREWLNSFYPGLMANGQIDGQTWGVPFQRSTIVAYYNKDMFSAAGLDPEAAPANWDELVSMGLALRETGPYGIMIPSTGYPYWMFQALAIQNGIELMNSDGTETYFDDPAVIEALEYWVSLSAEHDIMPSGTVEWGTLRQAFLEGQTAMMWHTTGNLTAVRDQASFDFGVAMLPEKVRRGSPTGGGNFYLFEGASDEEYRAALTLIRFLTDPERAAQWSIATGYVGVSAAAYDTDVLRAYVEEFPPALVARDQLEYSVAELATFEGARVRDALNTAIQSALTGSAAPADALAQAQAIADRLLAPYR
ncbi:MAG: ABC transporter substrate-binding protein [Roseinatronobacter sp.]